MSTITIRAGGDYDGEYELDDRPWNTREWRWIKQISRYTPSTYREGLEAEDPDLYLAFTVIAMCRAGTIGRDEGPKVAESLAEIPWDGSITILGEEAEPDVPLALTPRPGEQSSSGTNGSSRSSERTQSGSGESSRNGSERSDATPPRTTRLRSATS